MKRLFSVVFLFTITLLKPLHAANAQNLPDSLNQSGVKRNADSTVVLARNGDLYIYKRPRPFSFVTQLPKTIAWSAKMTFNKKSILPLAAITASTLTLIHFDQQISQGVQHFGRSIHIDPTRSYGGQLNLRLGGFKATIYDVPKNFNSAVYSLGEGLTSVMLAGGLFTAGKIKHDYRLIQSASQILQVQLAVGVLAQTVKRISGRESPFRATSPGGTWRPLPSFSSYQNNTSRYDAFPSGHLATMMATVTVLSLNYPEKQWIRWVGGSLITLVGFSMIHNGVHWSGDYPLALGIGYVTAYSTVKMNRWVKGSKRA